MTQNFVSELVLNKGLLGNLIEQCGESNEGK